MDNLDNILLAVFCFFSGAVTVGVILYLRNMGKPSASKESPPDPDLVEVARLWRSRKTNRMVVGLDGKNHATVEELSSGQHQRLASAASVLQTWLGESANLPPAPPPAAFTSAVDMPGQPPVSRGMAPPPLVTAMAPPQELKPIAPRPLDAFGRILTPGSGQSAVQFKSIPEQINEILQARLPGSPFESLGLSLGEVPGQGVVVHVGMEQYPGVEAVPDPAVREFIKQAVAEWEARTRGGIR
jgi:hypothetical protein